MSPVSTQYASALSVLTKDNPAIVSALPLEVLARAAGVNLDKWLDFPAGREIVNHYRKQNGAGLS